MTEPTLPPVGATVEVDGRTEKVTGYNFYDEPIWGEPFTRRDNHLYSQALTALWRMQQERDQLKARVAELEEDAAMLTWLDAATRTGALREIAETMPRIWSGDLRGFLREAMAKGYANVREVTP